MARLWEGWYWTQRHHTKTGSESGVTNNLLLAMYRAESLLVPTNNDELCQTASSRWVKPSVQDLDLMQVQEHSKLDDQMQIKVKHPSEIEDV